MSAKNIDQVIRTRPGKGFGLTAVRRDDTILRLGGDCYAAALTWTASNRQIVAIIDGAGWPVGAEHDYFSSRLFEVQGSPTAAAFRDIPTYPDIPIWDFLKGGAPYYGLNILSVHGRLYQYLSTTNHLFDIGQRSSWPQNFDSAKLIYSPDGGATWRNQDGTAPVRLEEQAAQSAENQVFFHEHQGTFVLPVFLQMGRDYAENRDGYVYVYSPNGCEEGTMNELVLMRVPHARILDRNAYEYFVRLHPDGSAVWSPDILERGIVHTFPRGLINMPFALGWLPSIVYNAALGLYMMVNSSGTNGGCRAARATYLGMWVAANPWGPWTQILEETSWLPGGDVGALAAAPQIAPKWISDDGRSFWLVWTDVQKSMVEDVDEAAYQARTPEEWKRARRGWRDAHPYFSFNTQRVDLLID